MRLMFLASGLMLALCGNAMAAQVYKWVDAQGVTHFGAQPPQGQQVAAQEAERKRYCETLRTNLAQLQNNPRVRVEENGETRRVTEEERQARISETRDKIAENCN